MDVCQPTKRVVIIDLDPQANLTAAFLDEERIEEIWSSENPGSTIYQCVKRLTGVGDIAEPTLQNIATDLCLLPGDVNLSGYEDALSNEWANSTGDNNLYRPMRILSSFYQVMQMAAAKVQADIILVDIGPNLGAINRSVLPDLFSLQGLKNLGPTLKSWRNLWQRRMDNWDSSPQVRTYADFHLPKGQMKPVGYRCQQHSVRLDRPVRAHDKRVNRMPDVYREAVLNEPPNPNIK